MGDSLRLSEPLPKRQFYGHLSDYEVPLYASSPFPAPFPIVAALLLLSGLPPATDGHLEEQLAVFVLAD